MTEFYLSDSNEFDLPKITEHDHSLWYSSIYTPEVEIWSISGGLVNNFWRVPQGWTSIIAQRLRELKERGW